MSRSGDLVGPVLLASDTGRVVAECIVQENPGATVRDRGGYLRVTCADTCRVTLGGIALALGRPFRAPADLEHIMPAFAGFLEITPSAVAWSAKRS